jgi:hypothetical protein
VMRGVARDVQAVERALKSPDAQRLSGNKRSLFGLQLKRFIDTVRGAEAEITELRAQLQQGTQRGAKG